MMKAPSASTSGPLALIATNPDKIPLFNFDPEETGGVHEVCITEDVPTEDGVAKERHRYDPLEGE